jgi:hypothetical protein
MNEWARYCSTPPTTTGEVVPINKRREAVAV